MNTRAIIFDLDGVLWNSSPVHEEAFRAAFMEQNVWLPANFYMGIAGMSTAKAVELLAKQFLSPSLNTEEVRARLRARKRELAARQLSLLQPDPDAERVLSVLRSRGFLLGLATSASRWSLNLFLGRLSSVTFDVALCWEDVAEAKPSPALYLQAAHRLSVRPEDCIVIEDSSSGIEAAKRAGMRVIGLGIEASRLTRADAVCETLSDIPSLLSTSGSAPRVKLSICITNTNHRDLLDNALRSIYQHPPSCAFEVLVVDNVSTDGSVDMVRAKYPHVIVTQNTERLGYPANCNRNMKKASGEYFLILNEDVEVLPGSLDAGIEYMERNAGVGMLGAAMILPTGELQLTSGRHFPTILTEVLGWSRLPEVFPKSKFFGHYLMSYWPHDTIREVDLVLEAGMLVRRKAVEEVGMMDEGFFFCYDGPDWAKRFWKAGWKVVFHPNMRIIHNEGQSSNIGKKPNPLLLIETMKSSVRYYTKHHGRLYALVFRCSMVAVFSLYCLKHLVSSIFIWGTERRNWLRVRLSTSFLMFKWYLGLS